ncbi:uncharacterized protein LOC116247458 [Nymphaea colorata]|nr:uncharacterized protein LOC116247458 [Nymphaea colorata]
MANSRKEFSTLGIFLLGFLYARVAVTVARSVPQDERRYTINNKRSISTVLSDQGDSVDCVDLYMQPAFTHPLLRNHTVQMRPTVFPEETPQKTTALGHEHYSQHALLKSWSCPEGTIPLVLLKTDYDGAFQGGSGVINIWNPHTEPNEFSSSKVLLKRDDEFIHCGWMVYPSLFGDDRTRLFTYWQGANGKGCYNLDCPGFVQVSHKVALGAFFTTISQRDGPAYTANFTVFKDPKDGNWWFVYQGESLGYWPGILFSRLRGSAGTVEWGGEVINANPAGPHTTTQMGSGAFPGEGFRRASVLSNAAVVDLNYRKSDPKYYGYQVDKPKCYDILDQHDRRGKPLEYYFFYGGPGLNPNCK